MRPGYDKAPCQDSTGKGCAEEETNHVHCGKLNKRNFCPTSASRTCVAVQTKRMETNMLCGVMTKLKQVQKSANDLAIPTK